jgi:hypothetical protein
MTPEEMEAAARIAAQDQASARNYDTMRVALKQWAHVMADFSSYLRDSGLGEDLVGDMVCQWNGIMAARVLDD